VRDRKHGSSTGNIPAKPIDKSAVEHACHKAPGYLAVRDRLYGKCPRKAMVAALLRERDDLHIGNLRLQVEPGWLQEAVVWPARRPAAVGSRAAAVAAQLCRRIGPQTAPPGRRSASFRATTRAATGSAAQGPAPSCQLRKPPCKHARLRTEWPTAGVSLLRPPAPGDWFR
jgi:hypothetical protein